MTKSQLVPFLRPGVTECKQERFTKTNMAVALLLEDEPFISLNLEVTLADAGFDVVPVTKCSDALAWLEDNAADIAIVDVVLVDGSSEHVV